ncbi:MAG: glycosyltransferase family 2 protein [Patescibacteria group bacterium]|nr:glycosyltransferase family 2 protein [Patescibacteria group bacterium]MDD5491022.1 glycosyltransferase family 2 protein [Patescibacteria group bacterium]
MLKFISIIIPVCNEEKNIPLLYGGLFRVLKELENFYQVEIIFVNDGSNDKSGEVLNNLAKQDPKVKFIDFSRNFGKEIALTAGLHHATGEAAITMDADLQHPAELIPEFLKKWEAGAEVVIGVRSKDKKEGLIKRIGSSLFYTIINLISETKVVRRATDFRLIDRKVINEFNRFSERNRMARALIDWLGFKRGYIYFDANSRKFGKPRYTYCKLIKLALSSFISLSLLPLKLAAYLGTLITLSSGSFLIVMFIVRWFFDEIYFSSISFVIMFNVLLSGVVLMCLGFIALYIGNIHGELLNRPLYIIKDKRNFR